MPKLIKDCSVVWFAEIQAHHDACYPVAFKLAAWWRVRRSELPNVDFDLLYMKPVGRGEVNLCRCYRRQPHQPNENERCSLHAPDAIGRIGGFQVFSTLLSACKLI